MDIFGYVFELGSGGGQVQCRHCISRSLIFSSLEKRQQPPPLLMVMCLVRSPRAGNSNRHTLN